MKEPSGKRHLVSGVLAGLVAALTMTLVMMLLRLVSGIATPPERVGDRIAPLLSVNIFLGLLDSAGGYNQLKQIGVVSVLAGQFIVGALGGLWYATQVARARRPERTGRLGVNRSGLAFVAVQTPEERGIVPAGSTRYQRVTVNVEARSRGRDGKGARHSHE
jgi:hypothetical protein